MQNMKKLDFLIIAIALILAGIFLLITINGKRGESVEIVVDGEVTAVFTLDSDTEYRVDTPEGWNIIKIHGGTVSVIESDCPNQICVKHKEISKSGESIICLPHKIIVRITGTNQETDALIN